MKKMILKLFVLAFLILGLAGIVLGYNHSLFMSAEFNIKPDVTVKLDVKPGRSIKSIAAELVNKKIISQPHNLVWAARLSGQARRLQAGEYAINNTITPTQFLNMLVEGKVIQYNFTIIEGWNVKQILAAIKNNSNLTHRLDNPSATTLMKKLGLPADLHAEGWFFPDTYQFIRGETDIKVLLRAQNAMQKNLNKAWLKRDKGLPYDTPYDALIMASIVEKETGKGDERPQIAGVFVRRLNKGMKLQTDPTVIYGIGDKYDGNIRRRDLRKDTPYNTYTRKGLPPTPIAMPGLASIEATLHPDNGTALYFVAKGDGSHVFSSNLKQHNEAVIKYQLKGRSKAFSSSPNGNDKK